MRTFLFLTPDGQTTLDEPKSLQGYNLYLHPNYNDVLVFIHHSRNRKGYADYHGHQIQAESLTQWMHCMHILNPDLRYTLPSFIPEAHQYRVAEDDKVREDAVVTGRDNCAYFMVTHGDRKFRTHGKWVVYTTPRAFLQAFPVCKDNIGYFADDIAAYQRLGVSIQQALQISNPNPKGLYVLYEPHKKMPTFYSPYDVYRWLRNNKPPCLSYIGPGKKNYFDAAAFLYCHPEAICRKAGKREEHLAECAKLYAK